MTVRCLGRLRRMREDAVMQGQPGDSSEQHHEPPWTFLVWGVTERPSRQVPGIIIASLKIKMHPDQRSLSVWLSFVWGPPLDHVESGIPLCFEGFGDW